MNQQVTNPRHLPSSHGTAICIYPFHANAHTYVRARAHTRTHPRSLNQYAFGKKVGVIAADTHYSSYSMLQCKMKGGNRQVRLVPNPNPILTLALALTLALTATLALTFTLALALALTSWPWP